MRGCLVAYCPLTLSRTTGGEFVSVSLLNGLTGAAGVFAATWNSYGQRY